MPTGLLLVHICSAIIGLLSGFLSMAFRKGSGFHRAAGTVFFVSMLTMSGSAAYIAAFLRPNMLNVTVGLLTFYLVATAWRAGRRRDGKTDRFDVVALVYICAVTLAGWTFGVQAANSPNGIKDHVPAPIYFVFATVALLCAISDVRMFRRGGLFGTYRIARHLWRMCLALLIATLSFFPGQARQLPDSLRHSGFMYAPHLFLIVSMIYWRLRYRARKNAPHSSAIAAPPENTMTANRAA